MIQIKRPKFKKTNAFLEHLEDFDPKPILHRFGRLGVTALASTTPRDTGETAAKWSYKIEEKNERYRLIWTNSEMAGDTPLVLLLQYGHGTKSGYFLSGIDFINPALRPVYNALHEALVEEALRR